MEEDGKGGEILMPGEKKVFGLPVCSIKKKGKENVDFGEVALKSTPRTAHSHY